jgi:hypothetical protein
MPQTGRNAGFNAIDSVNQATWFTMGTKAGGEAISSDSY